MSNELIGVLETEASLVGELTDSQLEINVSVAETGPRGIQGEQGLDGKSLEFHWNGAQLGIRIEGETTYQYVNLKGDKGEQGEDGEQGIQGLAGKNLEFNWNGTQLGVRQEGQTSYTYVDLKGTKGDTGNTGPTGKNIEFNWNGTQLGVRQEGQSSYQYVNLKGDKGDDGYTPIKDIDYFDGEQGPKGNDGYTPVKGVDYFDGKDGKDGLSSEQDIFDITPFGLQGFQIYDGGGIAYVNVPDSYRLGRRNFTVVKYFRSTVKAVGSRFFELSSSNGDYFAVGNLGYTFTVDIKLGGNSILSYRVDSDTVYDDGTLVDVFCCEVDYDRLEIRITSGKSFRKVISIPELTHIKGVDFENTTLFVNQYVYQCPYNFAVNCLIDYSMLSSFMNTDRTFPLQLIKNKGDISVIKTAPTGWGEYENAVPFVGGVATIPSSYFDGFGTNNKYLLPAFNPIDDLPSYNDAHQYRFSMDIENGSFTFNSTSASSGLPRFRATNKDTGETIDFIGVSNAKVMTLPPGRYLVEYYALTRIQYGNIRLIYPVGFGGIDSGATLKIYDDWEISPISVMTSAIARMANYNCVICPFTGQVGTGIYSLSDVFV